MAEASLKGKVALITGANKGIGFEIARQLALLGATALVGARDRGRGEGAARALAAEHLDARFLRIDVTEQSSIEEGARRIERDFGKLDILVNNAGIGIDNAPPSQLGMDVLRRTYDTNFFGVFAVTKAMLPLLSRSDGARIVNMSSGLGSLTQNSDPGYQYARAKLLAYNSSKAALNALTIQFAYELRETPIKVNAADPGYVATDLNSHTGTRTVEQGARIAVRLATLPPDGPTGGFFDEDGVVPW
jgi:NAD(P)-dependent dehydrogenase (short-subunit alcohol dehydrogenase family)